MGFFIDVFVIVVALMLIMFVVLQVVHPLFSGEPLFPIFRKSAVKDEIAKAEKTLETVAEAAHLKELTDKIETAVKAIKEPK